LSSADALDVFDSFWQLYPKKEAKGAAIKAFKAAVKKAGADKVIDGLKANILGVELFGGGEELLIEQRPQVRELLRDQRSYSS